MKRLLLLSLLLTQPAQAVDYLGFAPGATQPGMVLVSKEPPKIGQNCPIDWTVVPFLPTSNDLDQSHYTLRDGQLAYAPPAIPELLPAVQQPPDADTQLKAIWSALAGLGIQPDVSAAPDTAEGCMAKVQAAQAALQAAQIKVK